MTVKDLPTLNALLNLSSAILLLIGRVYIKRDKADQHKRYMLAATISSILFLTSYLIYHGIVGSVPYPYHNWTRPLYFAILIPHVILAGVMVPFIIIALWFAFHRRFDKHKRLTVWVWPVWIFVSVSGIIVYLMLYRF
jgi:uncharacterized membrane protein YozB (DUF420 family)